MSYEPELDLKILEWCNANLPKEAGTYVTSIKIDGYTSEQIKFQTIDLCKKGYIGYHSTKYKKGGVIKGVFQFEVPSVMCVDYLSKEGYEYLEQSRNPQKENEGRKPKSIFVELYERTISGLSKGFFDSQK